MNAFLEIYNATNELMVSYLYLLFCDELNVYWWWLLKAAIIEEKNYLFSSQDGT